MGYVWCTVWLCNLQKRSIYRKFLDGIAVSLDNNMSSKSVHEKISSRKTDLSEFLKVFFFLETPKKLVHGFLQGFGRRGGALDSIRPPDFLPTKGE